MGPTSGPHHGSFVNGLLDGGDGEYGVTDGAAEDGDFDVTGDMGPTSGPHHGSFVNGLLDGGDGEYGVTDGAADGGDFDITGYQGTTSGPHDGSFVNGMVDGGDQEYDDSDHDADVGVTERDDVGDAGLHRVPTSEFDFTACLVTKNISMRTIIVVAANEAVPDQFQILKERRGLIARALHSRTAQNQSQLATFPIHGGRAVNARETAPGQFPYHTLVLADNRVLCGGALLSVSVVLTAAQCVFRYKTWLVQLGSVELLVQNPHRQLIEGKRVKTHPLYSDKRTNDDIAVVFLKTSAVLNSYVKTVRLPTDMMREDLVGRMGIVAGWGRTHVRKFTSYLLI
ncbi:venom prothrombin activator vestarin-D1-like [Schistocerca serialis cubense]|uniref:venom prothrombin activator vestarin-D1-like n=1 Tax=Schistocerca serialis cubense TaxID=2023355 RepID=UPI00214ECBD5|nr:venom prothrombin activator vestarin-D1-like [Schistocerca serialis cubense]